MTTDISIFDTYQTVHSKIFLHSLLMEFFGLVCFQFIGGTANVVFGPFANGFALAVLVYIAANVSGGHLNPAVTFSTFICGYYPLMHTVLYICIQTAGAMCGALLSAALVPGAVIGSGNGPGCFTRAVVGSGITNVQIFGWEAVMTFVLISAVYSCGITKPGHGSFTPLVVGLSLTACASSGGSRTGAALNPARVLGPMAVFECGTDVAGYYIAGELTAAVVACLLFATITGWGPLAPWKAMKVFGLTSKEAMRAWLYGSPPKRLRQSKSQNIQELIANNKVLSRKFTIKHYADDVPEDDDDDDDDFNKPDVGKPDTV